MVSLSELERLQRKIEFKEGQIKSIGDIDIDFRRFLRQNPLEEEVYDKVIFFHRNASVGKFKAVLVFVTLKNQFYYVIGAEILL